jgi:hypothetical protein
MVATANAKTLLLLFTLYSPFLFLSTFSANIVNDPINLCLLQEFLCAQFKNQHIA